MQEKGWNFKPEVIAAICTEFSEALFETVVNSSLRKSRIFRLIPDRQVDAWQLISVKISRQRSFDISTTKGKLLGHAHARTHFSILFIKRPNPGMCRTWNFLDMCAMVANLVSQHCWFQNSFAQSRDHGSVKMYSSSLRNHNGDGRIPS